MTGQESDLPDRLAALHSSSEFLRAQQEVADEKARFQENLEIVNDPDFIPNLVERIEADHSSAFSSNETPPQPSLPQVSDDLPLLNLHKPQVQKDTELLQKHSNARWRSKKDSKRVDKLTLKPKRNYHKPGKQALFDRAMKYLAEPTREEVNRALDLAEEADRQAASDRKA